MWILNKLMKVEKKQGLHFVQEVNLPPNQNTRFIHQHTLTDMRFKYVRVKSKD